MDVWKGPIIGVCPHGLSIRLVDGTHVRNHHDSDFSQGGNGYRYSWIPKHEIWLDAEINPEERPLIAAHECQESELMKRGMSYDRAHAAAKRTEDASRRRPARKTWVVAVGPNGKYAAVPLLALAPTSPGQVDMTYPLMKDHVAVATGSKTDCRRAERAILCEEKRRGRLIPVEDAEKIIMSDKRP